MKLRHVILFVPILLLVPCLSYNLNAQTTTSGGLTGVVSDPSHAAVPDAVVEIRDNTKGTIQTAKTDSDGAYRFFFLAPGRYTLTASHAGFREESRDVNVLLGPSGTLNLTLGIARQSATVRVAGEVPLLQAENGDVSTTMNQKQISEVPNPGNDLTYIAQTAPGAIMNTDDAPAYNASTTGNFSILGMPGTSNLFTLNGMNNNNIQVNINNSGAMGMLLGRNEIQEATIVSNGYSGQFGGAAGASVNYLTKSGGNEFHGNAEYFWNGSALNANDWISNATKNPRPFDVANQWAGSVGGPIKKDKLFFFFDTEGMRVVLPLSFQVVVPSARFESATIANIDSIFGPTSASHNFYEQAFNLYNNTPGASAATPGNFNPGDLGCGGYKGPQGLGTTEACAVHFQKNGDAPSSESIVSGRLDWNIGTSDRAFLLAQYDHGQPAAYVDPISPLFNAYSNQPWWQGQLIETHTFGPTAANQFLLAGTYINQTTSVANSSQTLAAFPTTLNWNNAGGGAFSSLGGSDFFFALPSGSRTTQYQISDDFVKTRGKHKFGFGANLVRTHLTCCGYNFAGTGQLSPQSISAFVFGGVDPSNPSRDFTTLDQSYPAVTWNRYAFYTLGLYGQEEWHARSNLTLTFALRGDHQSNPVCETRCFARLSGPFNSISHDPDQPYDQAILINQKQAFRHTDSVVWSPRFSFAWQPLGVSHNTVIRGGGGIFYDPVPGALGTGLTFNSHFFSVSGYNLAPGETNSLFQNAANSNTAFAKGFATGQTLAQIQAADPNFTLPSFQTPANTIHSPQYQKWSLQAQQSFGASTSLTIGYFGNHGIHELVQNPNANAFAFGSFPKAVCSSPPIPPCADPRFGGVTESETNAVSNYNGMVVSFEQRFTRWGSGLFQANYTYGHALDEVSNGGVGQFAFGSSVVPQDANNLRGSYGPADYDVRHSFNANYVWEVPVKEALRGHGSDYLVNGWQISGTIFARTGFPYTVIDFAETGNLVTNNFFGTIYSVPVAPLGPAGPCGKGAVIPASLVPCQPPQVLGDGSPNPGALFLQSGCETGFNTGTLPGPQGPCSGPSVTFAQGRNRFRGPSYFNTDFAIMKNTKLPHWENGVLGIGFQFFNLFNHPNFGFPDMGSDHPGFGQIFYLEQAPTSILGAASQDNVSPRMIQLRVQLQF